MKTIIIRGQKIALQDQWLRITENPDVAEYPKTGNIIELKNHNLIPDGIYFITFVKEYEPPYTPDIDGRDIRIDLINKDTNRVYKGMNGVNILKSIPIVNIAKNYEMPKFKRHLWDDIDKMPNDIFDSDNEGY